ncbi:hypothetical protein SNE40_012011 [Patella caerulea]|uniref:rRNA-processing protein EBP2 n=1 Tax=Patella caerulea TaxID=87958 RepID=A0AAN8JPH0_PATCE
MALFKKFTNRIPYESDESVSSDAESLDSDEELQNAFAAGKLKSGFVIEAAPKKQLIKNTTGLRQKLDEMKQDLAWIERLDMINDSTQLPKSMVDEDNESGDADVHNDFKREMKFYRQAQAAVLEALPRLQKLGLKTKRPEDYFAEMAKSDDHMKRVREKLLEKTLGMERSEKAKKLRDLRKYGKQVQKEVLQKRQKEKRDMLEAVKKYRKGQKDKLDFLNNDDFEENDKKNKKVQKGGKGGKPGVNRKRVYKNAKFGFGGQKKRSKMNTKDSVNNVSQYGKNFSKIRSSKKGMKNKRPGKSRRQNTKSRK